MLLDDRKDVPAMAVSITGIRVENSPARMIENKRFKQAGYLSIPFKLKACC